MDVIKNLLNCCKHECLRGKKVFYFLPSIIHFALHIIVGFLLYDYVPNKKIVAAIAFVDAVSHYAGILGIFAFVFNFIKNRLLNYKNKKLPK